LILGGFLDFGVCPPSKVLLTAQGNLEFALAGALTRLCFSLLTVI